MENLPGSLPVGLGCVSLGKFCQIIKQETLPRETAEMVTQTSGRTQKPHKNGTCALISTFVASQLWGPGICTHILVTRLAQVTALGKTERFFPAIPSPAG